MPQISAPLITAHLLYVWTYPVTFYPFGLPEGKLVLKSQLQPCFRRKQEASGLGRSPRPRAGCEWAVHLLCTRPVQGRSS
eukprot:scaffold200715_cov31-Tisochrysis_lutea.AAC.2